MVSEKQVRLALKRVIDPELGVNIVDLGLVYNITVEGGGVEVEMTLTTPGCPLAPVIDQMVKTEVGKIPEVKEVSLELVWDPPWTMEMMDEGVRAELGLD